MNYELLFDYIYKLLFQKKIYAKKFKILKPIDVVILLTDDNFSNRLYTI